jgi:hypothetical protein
MRPAAAAIVLALAAPALAAAQEPVQSFDQLNTRLKAGGKVWVTDAQGRETKGTVLGVAPDALVLDDGRSRTFGPADVRAIREPAERPIGKPALWGTVAGAGTGLLLALAARGEYATYCSPQEAAAGCFPPPGAKTPIDWWSVPVMAGAGAGIGAVVGALMPRKPRLVYVAPEEAAGAPPGAPVPVAPVTAPRAQQPVRSFDALNTRLKVGDTVWVTDAGGRETGGKVSGFSAGSLRVVVAGRTREFEAADVSAITLQPKDSLHNGVLLGAVAGAGAGIASCAANPQCIDDEAGPGITASLGLLGAAAGAGVGALVDAAFKPSRLTVYRSPGASPARLSVAPVVTRRAKGVVVAFTF